MDVNDEGIWFFEDINFGIDAVIYDSFEIDLEQPVASQLENEFTCDLFQAQLGNNFCIDLGWYDYDDGSSFGLLVVKDADWDNPLLQIRTCDLAWLKISMQFCVDAVKREIAASVNGAGNDKA